MNNYAYKYGENVYINLTNKCCNNCIFCIRNTADGIGEDCLWLQREPTVDEVVSAVCPLLPGAQQIVFCGYGESTYCMDVLLQSARILRSHGLPIRLNTNGLGNLINGRDIVPSLVGLIDICSVSLNAPGPAEYVALCCPEFGLDAWPAVVEFATACRDSGIQTVLSVLETLPPDQLATCQNLANRLGLPLNIRQLI